MQLQNLQEENKWLANYLQYLCMVITPVLIYGLSTGYWLAILFIGVIAVVAGKTVLRYFSFEERKTVQRLLLWTTLLSAPLVYFYSADIRFFSLPQGSLSIWVLNHVLFICLYLFVMLGSIFLTNRTGRRFS